MYPGQYSSSGQYNQQQQQPPSNGQPPPQFNGQLQQPPYNYQQQGPYPPVPGMQGIPAVQMPGHIYQQPMPVPMAVYQQPQVSTPIYQQVPNPQVFNVPTGRKKALLIGINYFGQRNELKGCINDVHNVKKFICERYGFPCVQPESMVILTDDQQDRNYQPTKQNIVNAMKWLVGGAQPGDSLFFHFSGHGGEVIDRSGDEADGYDSCIYSVDHAVRGVGPLIDDDMHELMVKYLPAGVRLTAILDCCHSGTALDLPYLYNSDGSLKKYTPAKQLASSVQASAGQLKRGNAIGAALSLVGNVLTVATGSAQRAEQITQQTRTTMADVVMFSGCKDSQTSADTHIRGVGATGAMSFALIQALSQNPQPTYISLLQNIRGILMQRYSQKPQMSTGKPMDMNSLFML